MASLRGNVFWAFVANGIATALTWIMLLILTKLGSVEEVGLFALSQAVALPIHMFLTFKLRVVQSTDHHSEFLDDDYRNFRLFAAIFNFVAAASISFFLYDGEIYKLILIMSLSYSFIIYREFYISILQKNERNDLIACSNIAHGVGSLLFFLSGYLITNKLWVGVLGILVSRCFFTSIYDRYLCRGLSSHGHIGVVKALRSIECRLRLYNLLKIGLPLGGVALLGTLFTSIPRFALEKFESLEMVGYYAALASLLVVLNLFVTSFGQSVTPRLALLYSENKTLFLRKFALFFSVCMGFIILCVILSYFFSGNILTLLFTKDYAVYNLTFFKLMIAGALLAAFSIMNIGISAQRAFKVQFPIYLSCAITVVVACALLIPKFGIDGAAYSYALCNFVGLVFSFYVFMKNMKLGSI